MGNEKSALKGIEIDEKAVEVTDFWMHHCANVDDPNLQRVSIFISEPSLHYAASFGKPSPLEKIAKNLMLHRHPCILRYISCWSKGSKFFLTTEEARPLIQVIKSQSTLQICIGLYSILRALSFLHDNALASHNNICSSSIYVTPEGCWKLGGLEFLQRFDDFSPSYFQKIKTYRLERSVASNEDITALISTKNFTAIDAYAFGVLAEDILSLKDADDVPALAEFREFCKENLQNQDPSLRSRPSSVLQHPFFTHDFVRIHAFLEELPLRSDAERQEFFINLIKRLRAFPEEVVAEQLSRLLLSRMVLLDCTAQIKLIPSILKPKDQDDGTGLFTIPIFKRCVVPVLLQIFCIRDASIRLLLLTHFKSFVYAFQTEELKCRILPELLVGIKDTNDLLVSSTLKALAEVIPILGAATVIGGNRGKLFTDGRPNKTKEHKISDEPRATANGFSVAIDQDVASAQLPERPSPDGGEDKRELTFASTEEESAWSDWDAQEVESHRASQIASASPQKSIEIVNDKSNCSQSKKSIISDISELDIKLSKSMKATKEEVDFFMDMEPVIKKTQVLHVQEENESTKSMFDVKSSGVVTDDDENDGWGEDLNDWGADDSQILNP